MQVLLKVCCALPCLLAVRCHGMWCAAQLPQRPCSSSQPCPACLSVPLCSWCSTPRTPTPLPPPRWTAPSRWEWSGRASMRCGYASMRGMRWAGSWVSACQPAVQRLPRGMEAPFTAWQAQQCGLHPAGSPAVLSCRQPSCPLLQGAHHPAVPSCARPYYAGVEPGQPHPQHDSGRP